jgi:hypothetical protein
MMEKMLTDPFAFFEAFPAGQSLSVVGNSGSLAAWRMGRVIDRADVVIRFNECRLRGWKAQVGERTDLLITNPYVEKRERTIGIEVHPKMAMVIFPHQRRGSRQELFDWLGGVPVVMTFAPRLLKVSDVSSPLTISTGTYGVYLVSRLLLPSRMFVTGFSMFSAHYAPYYWSAAMPPGVAKHDFPREALVFAQLLNTFNHPIEITPDVAEIFAVAQVKTGNHIRMITPEPGEGGNLQ